ncbi:MAG: hypothetical protein AB1430_10230 [Pseudomonadota bacterium]
MQGVLAVHAIIIERTFTYGDVKIFVALDEHCRRFIGVGLSLGERGNVVFIQVREDTVSELEQGRVALSTVIQHRGIGLIFEMPHQVVKRLRAAAQMEAA